MNAKRTKLILLAIIGTCLAAVSTMAAITPIADDFDTGIGNNGTWVHVGANTNGVIEWDENSANDYDKTDQIQTQANALDGDGIVGNLAGDTEATGDGTENDGGLRLNTDDDTVGNEAMGLTIAGTMEENELITLTASIYNDGGSASTCIPELYNLTDGTLLAAGAGETVKGNGHASYVPVTVSVNYTAKASDAGDVLQIRFRENNTLAVRDIFVDNLALTSEPEVLYAYEGFDTANAIGSDVTAAGVTGSGFGSYTNTHGAMELETGLDYLDSNNTPLITTGKSGGMDLLSTGTQNLQLDLATPIVNSGQTIYFSFLTDVTAVDSFGVQIGLVDTFVGSSSSPTAALESAFRSTSSNWGIYADSNGIDERTGPATGTGQFLVVSELNLGTGVMTTYLNPTNLNDVANSATHTLSGTATAALSTIQGFIFSLGGQEAGTIDEIRIGNTMDVVVPTGSSIVPTLYAYEGFVNGGIGDKTMDTALSGSGFTLMTNSNFRFVTSTGLSYVDGAGNTLESCGNSSGINPSANGTQNLQLSFPEISSGKLYVSFITDALAVNTWGFTLGLQDSQVDGSASVSPNNTLEAGIRSTSNANSGWGLYNPNGLDNRSSTGPLGLNFIVMEVDIDNDAVVAWINPTDLTDVPGSSTVLTDGGDTYTVGPVNSFLFSLAGDEAGHIDEIRIANTLDLVVPTFTPVDYTAWTVQYNLTGSNTNTTANPDGDALINLHEFALGGNPTNAADIGYVPDSMVAEADSSTWLYYTYPKRCDAHIVGLDYYLQTTTNLVDGVWTNGGYEVVGVGIDAYGAGFNAITNRVSTEIEPEQFIKLIIE